MVALKIHLFLKEGLESNNAYMPNLIMNQGSCDGSVEECQTNYSNDLGSLLLIPMLREQTQPGSRWLKRTRLGFIYFRECRAFGSQQIYLKRLALPRGKSQWIQSALCGPRKKTILFLVTNTIQALNQESALPLEKGWWRPISISQVQNIVFFVFLLFPSALTPNNFLGLQVL